jgi:hypothetical protein
MDAFHRPSRFHTSSILMHSPLPVSVRNVSFLPSRLFLKFCVVQTPEDPEDDIGVVFTKNISRASSEGPKELEKGLETVSSQHQRRTAEFRILDKVSGNRPSVFHYSMALFSLSLLLLVSTNCPPVVNYPFCFVYDMCTNHMYVGDVRP